MISFTFWIIRIVKFYFLWTVYKNINLYGHHLLENKFNRIFWPQWNRATLPLHIHAQFQDREHLGQNYSKSLCHQHHNMRIESWICKMRDRFHNTITKRFYIRKKIIQNHFSGVNEHTSKICHLKMASSNLHYPWLVYNTKNVRTVPNVLALFHFNQSNGRKFENSLFAQKIQK